MNAMSVSPVKPTISPGNHAVPATATNLTKSPLPSNNFTPINLIPEAKPVPSVNATPANTENSVDLCSKPPTSNGIISPIPETKSKENSADVPQNHTEKSNIAENLSITDASLKPIEVVPEIVKNVEKPKHEEPTNIALSKENSESAKEIESITAVESAKEPVKDEKRATEEKKVEPLVNDVKDGKESESQKNEVKTTEANSELVTDSKKETPLETKSTPEKAKEQKEPESETNNEKGVETEESKTEPSSESTPVPKPTKRKAKQPVEPVEDDGKEGRKSKRVRLPTMPYQSPIPELQFIAKLQTPAKTTPKPTAEKIIAFFKNEFLAVRNPEGSFYICQTFQNIHKCSSRIKIRWFTNLPNDVFTPDFCDVTEFDCILTNVQMTRVEKDRWKLPEIERTRIENILKRALDVEKGVADQPSLTEEHPDGLDLSLFKDEAQLKKKKKKKSASPKAKAAKETATSSGASKKSTSTKSAKPAKTVAAAPATSSTKKSARLSNLSQTAAKETTAEKPKPVENKTKKDKKKNKGKHGASTKASPSTKQNDKAKVWEPSVKSSNSSKVVLSLKKETPPTVSKTATSETTTTKTATKRTSSVSSRASATSTSPAAVPQKRRKDESKSAAANQPVANERTGKVRNAGSAVAAKINSAAMRTTKEKERKVSNTSSQRKK